MAVVVNPVPRGGHEQAHDGAEEVEEAVGEVGEGGYAEHGALRHAAGVPGHQHRGDGHGVLGAAAQQTALVAAAVVDALEHAAVEQNADVLVGYGQVEHEARAHRGAHQAHPAAHHAHKELGDALHHAACRHRTAEAHGAHNEPDGGHHARHAPRGHQVVQHGVRRGQRGAAIEALHHAAQHVAAAHLGHGLGLEHEAEAYCQQGGEEERDERWQAARYHHPREQWHEQQPRRHVEALGQCRAESLHLVAVGRFYAQPLDGEDGQRYEQRGRGGDEHVAYVLEERHAHRTGSQHRGVGQGRHLVAEVCAANDGACYPSVGKALGASYAHQRNADGGHGGPRRARHDAHQCADDAARSQEDARPYHLHAVVDECGHHAAHHPRAAQCADEEQDDECRPHVGYVVANGLFKGFPRHAQAPHAQRHAQGAHHEQRHLTGSRQRIAAIGAHHQHEHAHQHHERQQRDEGRRHGFLEVDRNWENTHILAGLSVRLEFSVQKYRECLNRTCILLYKSLVGINHDKAQYLPSTAARSRGVCHASTVGDTFALFFAARPRLVHSSAFCARFLSRRPVFTARRPAGNRCYVKNFTYDVSFFTYDVIFFT